ncbi:hypothetical protein PQX77_005365 [Marasmius sp. AFHP31]|nr:hypothetical protein PQX77_005365 [Marasmius sp. AFHP31]
MKPPSSSVTSKTQLDASPNEEDLPSDTNGVPEALLPAIDVNWNTHKIKKTRFTRADGKRRVCIEIVPKTPEDMAPPLESNPQQGLRERRRMTQIIFPNPPGPMDVPPEPDQRRLAQGTCRVLLSSSILKLTNNIQNGEFKLLLTA